MTKRLRKRCKNDLMNEVSLEATSNHNNYFEEILHSHPLRCYLLLHHVGNDRPILCRMSPVVFPFLALDKYLWCDKALPRMPV